MAESTPEERLIALMKSIEVISKDAAMDPKYPPVDLFNEERMKILQSCYLFFDPKTLFDNLIAVEPDRNVLKKDLFSIIKIKLFAKKGQIFEELSKHFLQKYKNAIKENDITENEVMELIYTFPDIVYQIMERRPKLQPPLRFTIYPNFKPIHQNIGILGLLPEGKKYGGFVKAMLHIKMRKIGYDFSEGIFAFCRCIYHSPITSHSKREKWFAKLKISQVDCFIWSRIFQLYYPEYSDIHKYFGQIA